MRPDAIRAEIDRLLDALKTEMVINQALIDILVDKGVFSHDELQQKIKEIRIRSGILLSTAGSDGDKAQ